MLRSEAGHPGPFHDAESPHRTSSTSQPSMHPRKDTTSAGADADGPGSRRATYSHPFSWAMLAASMRERAPSLTMAEER
jgi:hypothetical protein